MRARGRYLSPSSVSGSVMGPCDDRTSSIRVPILASIHTFDPPGPEPGFSLRAGERAGCRTLLLRSAVRAHPVRRRKGHPAHRHRVSHGSRSAGVISGRHWMNPVSRLRFHGVWIALKAEARRLPRRRALLFATSTKPRAVSRLKNFESGQMFLFFWERVAAGVLTNERPFLSFKPWQEGPSSK